MSWIFGGTDGDDFCVGLNKNCVAIVVEPIKVRDDPTAVSEVLIESSVRVVADNGKVLVRVIVIGIGYSGDHNFSVELKRNGVGNIRCAVKVGRYLTSPAEGLIQIPGCAVS